MILTQQHLGMSLSHIVGAVKVLESLHLYNVLWHIKGI